MVPPMIGITSSRNIGPGWSPNAPGNLMDYIFVEYSRAVLFSGGIPVMIPIAKTDKSIPVLLDRLDGVIISGGPDIHPKYYGEEPLAGLGESHDGLDKMDMEVTRVALRRNLPLFAICRGLQVLNVSMGGTLYQDIPTQLKGSINHLQMTDKSTNTHTVKIEENTQLHTLFKRRKIWVNGKHHQAIKRVAPNLTVSARAADGIIEAVEIPEKHFCIGVQWHPEGTWENDTHSKKLFKRFIRTAAEKAPGEHH